MTILSYRLPDEVTYGGPRWWSFSHWGMFEIDQPSVFIAAVKAFNAPVRSFRFRDWSDHGVSGSLELTYIDPLSVVTIK